MSDIVDRGNDRMQQQLEDALAARRPALPHNGVCNWCGDPAPGGASFCGADCRDDHAAQQRLKGVR